MIQEINYRGHTASPSDYSCPDGDLALSLNLINEEGAVRPVCRPSHRLSLAAGDRLALIHSVGAARRNLIFVSLSSQLRWMPMPEEGQGGSSSSATPVDGATDLGAIGEVTAVGNTLCVATDKGLLYILWKGEDEGYLCLGTHLPELPVSFGLQGEVVRSDEFEVEFPLAIKPDRIFDELSDTFKNSVTLQVLAQVNKFIAERSVKAGKFIFPFFVRYAYRLYDGSLTMHSAPVLMICSSDIAPAVFWTSLTGNSSAYTAATCRVAAVLHTLDYAVVTSHNPSISYIRELQNWKDIVRSVDIFISAPVYTYDQNGQCARFIPDNQMRSFCVCRHSNQNPARDPILYPLYYQYKTFNDIYSLTFDSEGLFQYNGFVELPARTADQVKADIRSVSNFYLLKSIPLEELSASRTPVAVEEDYLQALVAREAMTDDYDSHDTLVPRYLFSYNSRLNAANLTKTLFQGYHPRAMFCHTDGYVDYSHSIPSVAFQMASVSVSFFIRKGAKEFVVRGDSGSFGQNSRFLFFFYPDVGAYKAVFSVSGTCYEVPLEPHSFLNGAFYFGGWENATQLSSLPAKSSDLTVELPNKLYTSEVNNPFLFPVTGITTVGAGTILGISAAAKALSQGQFGQFPLYAFTDEGVWALETGTSGSFVARQPITRDVCVNPEGITQIDSAVLFPTARGIMLISGSQTQCISDPVDSLVSFAPASLKGFDIIAGNDTNLLNPAVRSPFRSPMVPFREYLEGCRMAYDYPGQRILLFNPDKSYFYIFSLKSQSWGMAHGMLVYGVNAYPDAMAVDSNGRLLDFSVTTQDTPPRGLLVSRPLKLGMADVLKSVDTVIQRGVFPKGAVQSVLYGSRDLSNWHLVWSSKDHYLRGFRGSPYKYFRIALSCSLRENESISGATVQFEPRKSNQPR